ncbi:RF-1 domain-containing protein [Flammula alnicola]|nr:RF-1 domain-containing protein [Flammula alnicola]
MLCRLAASSRSCGSVLFRCPATPCIRYVQTATSSAANLPKPPPISDLITEKDNADALAWVTEFSGTDKKIPRELVELSFSRSSGPGGQNVNKVNTKATLRCSLNESWIPRWAESTLMKNPHYVAATHSMLVTSTVHRSQAQNIEECLGKLHSMILSAASSPIKKEPSAEQKKKVEGLMKADKARRKTDKIHRSSVKQGRRGKGGGFDF